MITIEIANKFAADWIAAWNSHDIDRIIDHYAHDVDFVSPMIVRILAKPDGKIGGTTELKKYFTKGLEAYPDLKFELYNVLAGMNSIVIHYKSVKNLIAAEVFILDADGKVKDCICNYKEI
jgi:hypothetical protein